MQLCCTVTFVYLFCFSLLHLIFSTEEVEQAGALQSDSTNFIGISWTSGALTTGVALMVLAFQYRAMVTSLEDVTVQQGLFLCCCFLFIQCCVSTYNFKQSIERPLLAQCGLLLKYTCLLANLVYYQLIHPNSSLNKMQRRPLIQKSEEETFTINDMPSTSIANKED